MQVLLNSFFNLERTGGKSHHHLPLMLAMLM